MIVKICGITREEDLAVCARYGVDWIGLNLWPGSKRHVPEGQAEELAGKARMVGLVPVAILVEADAETMAGVWRRGAFELLQLYEPAGEIPAGARRIRPIPVDPGEKLPEPPPDEAEYHLFEPRVPGYGGQGTSFDWGRLRATSLPRPYLVGGGIQPDNVDDLLRNANPDGIDVASGVETAPGVKDERQIRTLMEAVRNVEGELE